MIDDRRRPPDAGPAAVSRSDAAIFTFQQRGLRRLLVWGIFSIALGLLQQRRSTNAEAAFGRQFVRWGAVDALLALGGLALSLALQQQHRLRERLGADTSSLTDATRRILRGSVILDLLLLSTGIAALRRAGADDKRYAAGRAMIAQACFLTTFDALHAVLLE